MWTITAADDETGERGTVAEVEGNRAEALLRGCEAAVDGWYDVKVEGPFGTVYPIVGSR